MNSRTVAISGVAACVLVVIGLVFRAPPDIAGPSASHAPDSTTFVLPELSDALNEVARMVVVDSTGTCTLERAESGWTVAEKQGFSANMERVRQTLIAASELRILDRKTANPELFERLGLRDLDAEGSVATKLELQDQSGGNMGGLLIGKRRSGAGDAAHYVRRLGENQCWLASGNLTMRAETDFWLSRDIMKLKAERIRSVETLHPDGEKVVVAKADKTARRFDVRDVPRGRELRYATVGDGLGRALERLTLDDVLPASEVETPGQVTESIYSTFDGVVVLARLWEEGDQKRAAFEVRFDAGLVEPEPEPEAVPEEPADDAESTAGEDADAEPEGDAFAPPEPPAFTPELLSAEEAREEAEQLNVRLSPWVFVLPSYAHDRMAKRMEEMLKEQESSET